MRRVALFFLLCLGMGTTILACQRQNNVCPAENDQAVPKQSIEDLVAMPSPTPPAQAVMVEIGGKMLPVDKIVAGPLCNDTWRGTVYVSCDAQVAAWTDVEKPLFLQGCNLNIEPNTVVYVAAHNDAAYYKGCSCHTGAEPVP